MLVLAYFGNSAGISNLVCTRKVKCYPDSYRDTQLLIAESVVRKLKNKMNKQFKKILLPFLLIVVNFCYSQKDSLNQESISKILVGKWIKKTETTQDGETYTGLKCKDTIEYFINGKYKWNQCGIDETGDWKISDDGKLIIFSKRDNKYWKEKLNLNDLGNMESPIFKLSSSELITGLIDEEKGWINKIYIRLK